MIERLSSLRVLVRPVSVIPTMDSVFVKKTGVRGARSGGQKVRQSRVRSATDLTGDFDARENGGTDSVGGVAGGTEIAWGS